MVVRKYESSHLVIQFSQWNRKQETRLLSDSKDEKSGARGLKK